VKTVGAAESHPCYEGIPLLVAAVKIGAVVGIGLVEVNMFLFKVVHGILTAFGTVHHQFSDEEFQHAFVSD
jgi:hypothetical protein